MKLLIVCSTSAYDKIPSIIHELNDEIIEIIFPNGYEQQYEYNEYDNMTKEEYINFFKKMYYQSKEKVSLADAILVLNYDKEKNNVVYKNYIGASTFLEMYEAYMQQKPIYLLNDYPENMLYDEVKGFNPIIINQNLELIKSKIDT